MEIRLGQHGGAMVSPAASQHERPGLSPSWLFSMWSLHVVHVGVFSGNPQSKNMLIGDAKLFLSSDCEYLCVFQQPNNEVFEMYATFTFKTLVITALTSGYRLSVRVKWVNLYRWPPGHFKIADNLMCSCMFFFFLLRACCGCT